MKWLHNILKGASLTTALFVFEACYGIPGPPMLEDEGEAPMTFKLVSKGSETPLEGIHIKANATSSRGDFKELGVTGADGTCKVTLYYVRNLEGPFIRFEDANGLYEPKDTSLADLRERLIQVELNPSE